jgi:hypothetical protein
MQVLWFAVLAVIIKAASGTESCYLTSSSAWYSMNIGGSHDTGIHRCSQMDETVAIV